jgi:hypothetical protein
MLLVGRTGSGSLPYYQEGLSNEYPDCFIRTELKPLHPWNYILGCYVFLILQSFYILWLSSRQAKLYQKQFLDENLLHFWFWRFYHFISFRDYNFLILCIYPPYFYYDASLRGLVGSLKSEFRCSRYGRFHLSVYASFHGGGYNPPRTSRTKSLVYLWADGPEGRTMAPVWPRFTETSVRRRGGRWTFQPCQNFRCKVALQYTVSWGCNGHMLWEGL